MNYVRLGNSGLKVSKLILGCMNLGRSKEHPWKLEEAESIKHIKHAYDLGINAFDTANMYGNGTSEIILGKAIKQHNLPREEIVVLTKVFFPVDVDAEGNVKDDLSPEDTQKQRATNRKGLSRKCQHIFDSVRHSLHRLQLDYVDVLQCHRFDPDTPVEETMHALNDVVKTGLARYIGISSCYAWQFHKMQNYARNHGLVEFISMQNFHNALYREEEREMIPLPQDLGVGMIPWSPLAMGILARPLQEETPRSKISLFSTSFKDETGRVIVERVAAIAEARGTTRAQIAIAWSLSKPFMTAPIVGPTIIEEIDDLCAGIHLKFTEEGIRSIDEPYKPRPIIGH